MNEIQDIGRGVTIFTVEQDEIGWKALSTRDGKVIEERYSLKNTEEDAKVIKTQLVNEFWGFQIN